MVWGRNQDLKSAHNDYPFRDPFKGNHYTETSDVSLYASNVSFVYAWTDFVYTCTWASLAPVWGGGGSSGWVAKSVFSSSVVSSVTIISSDGDLCSLSASDHFILCLSLSCVSDNLSIGV